MFSNKKIAMSTSLIYSGALALGEDCFLSTRSLTGGSEVGVFNDDELILREASNWLTDGAQVSAIETCTDGSGALTGIRMAVGFPELQDASVVQGTAADQSPYIWMNSYGTLVGQGITCDQPMFLQKGQEITGLSMNYNNSGVTGFGYSLNDGSSVQSGIQSEFTKEFSAFGTFEDRTFIGLQGYHEAGLNALGIVLLTPDRCPDILATPESQAAAFSAGEVDVAIPALLALELVTDSSSGLSTGALISIIASGIVAVAALVGVIICCTKKHNKGTRSLAPMDFKDPDMESCPQSSSKKQILTAGGYPHVIDESMMDGKKKKQNKDEEQDDSFTNEQPQLHPNAYAATDNEGRERVM